LAPEGAPLSLKGNSESEMPEMTDLHGVWPPNLVVQTTIRNSMKWWNAYEMHGNTWKINDNAWKHMEIHWNAWKMYGKSWKYIEIHGNTWKSMKTNRNTLKTMQKYMEIYEKHMET
jgi:hypothetical protein